MFTSATSENFRNIFPAYSTNFFSKFQQILRKTNTF